MAGNVSPELRRRIIDAALAAERDLASGLSVTDLADHAGVSDKHFQRCFQSVVGESPKSYLRRIRLQHSAYLLKWSDLPVTAIAMQAGFKTHAGFTRAFSTVYSLSPQRFRDARSVAPYLSAREQPAGALEVDSLEASRLVVRLQHQPAWRVAAIRHIGPVETMAAVWPRMMAWASRRGLMSKDAIFLGIHNDYWDPIAEDRYRYDAAIVVPDDFESDDRVNTFVLPAGDVAMTEFNGSLREADAVWRRFADQWLPVSGFQLRANLAYDRYPASLMSGGLIGGIIKTLRGIRATFCMPVKK
ncbi:MAG: GyrI-like domain-containing protein [Planctomycetota bacterium]